MTEKAKSRIVVDEEPSIVDRLDAIADAEGTTRAAIVRRIIRRFLFPALPAFGNTPEQETRA